MLERILLEKQAITKHARLLHFVQYLIVTIFMLYLAIPFSLVYFLLGNYPVDNLTVLILATLCEAMFLLINYLIYQLYHEKLTWLWQLINLVFDKISR